MAVTERRCHRPAQAIWRPANRDSQRRRHHNNNTHPCRSSSSSRCEQRPAPLRRLPRRLPQQLYLSVPPLRQPLRRSNSISTATPTMTRQHWERAWVNVVKVRCTLSSHGSFRVVSERVLQAYPLSVGIPTWVSSTAPRASITMRSPSQAFYPRRIMSVRHVLTPHAIFGLTDRSPSRDRHHSHPRPFLRPPRPWLETSAATCQRPLLVPSRASDRFPP